MSDIRPANWALSEQYQTFIQKAETDSPPWQPDISFYILHVRRIADSKSLDKMKMKMNILLMLNNIFYSNFWQKCILYERLAF